jgi:hypothetical protein
MALLANDAACLHIKLVFYDILKLIGFHEFTPEKYTETWNSISMGIKLT